MEASAEPPRSIDAHLPIDAHLHFWRYSPERFDWFAPDSVLASDHLPPHVEPLLTAAGVTAGIAVQAEQTEAETEWLLDLARRHPWIVGVVGWCDLRAADAAQRIARLAQAPRLVGIRHIVQAEPAGFMRIPAFVAGVRAVQAAGLTYDVLIHAGQAGEVPELIEAAPTGRFVLDHGGKPPIAQAQFQPWADAVRRIAGYPNVWCKLSGLVTEADHAAWQAEAIHGYMEWLLACFGPDRLLYGSDWPVCRLAADYGQVHALVRDFVARRCPAHADAIFCANAVAAYRL